MSSLSASRLYYGMKEGIEKTELDLTVKDLVDKPFSLDWGMEGGKHHINFIVLYYSEDIGKGVEKLFWQRLQSMKLPWLLQTASWTGVKKTKWKLRK